MSFIGLLLIVAALIVIATLALWTAQPSKKERAAAEAVRASADTNKRRELARMTMALADRRAYLASLQAEYPLSTACRMNGVESDLLMDSDGTRLLFLLARTASVFSANNAYELPVTSIASIQLETRTTTETMKRTEDVIIPQANNKSTVGRAVVGGLLLGPAGAMVGAASSMKGPPPKIEKREIKEIVQREGVPLIVIYTKDPKRPVLKLDLTRKVPTEEWYARLLGATS